METHTQQGTTTKYLIRIARLLQFGEYVIKIMAFHFHNKLSGARYTISRKMPFKGSSECPEWIAQS